MLIYLDKFRKQQEKPERIKATAESVLNRRKKLTERVNKSQDTIRSWDEDKKQHMESKKSQERKCFSVEDEI